MMERRKTKSKTLATKRTQALLCLECFAATWSWIFSSGIFSDRRHFFFHPALPAFKLRSLNAKVTSADFKRREAFTVGLMSLARQILESRLNCSPVRVIPFLTSAVPPPSFVTFPPRQLETLHLLNFILSNLQTVLTLAVYFHDLTIPGISVWAQHLQAVLTFSHVSQKNDLPFSLHFPFIIRKRKMREIHFVQPRQS